MLGGKMLLMKVRFILERDEENAWKSERQFLRVFFFFSPSYFYCKDQLCQSKTVSYKQKRRSMSSIARNRKVP